MRILVAEDEKDLNRLISSRLKAEHYSVDSCFDGQEALDYLAGAPYDAVILDIMMPVMDGLSVLRQLRQKGSQVPVLLLRTPPREIPQTVCRLDDLEVHLDTHQVLRAGREIKLSGKEFALLRYMIQNVGIVLSRDRLEQHLWNYDYVGGSNVIDVYIRYLRKKIDDGAQTKLIHTVRGAGYVMRTES